MKPASSDQESIIALLTRIYQYILEIELEFGLLAGDGDYRPRVDFFHDAIRAFTSKDKKHHVAGGRLSVEYLAYDLSCLRYLQEMPLAPFKPHAQSLSPSAEIIAMSKKPATKTKRPDRLVKERLSELYQHYAVLFAALLKPSADRDYHDRVDSLNQDVGDLSGIIAQLEALAKGNGSVDALASSIQHLDDDSLRAALMAFMQKQKHKKRADVMTAIAQLKDQIGKKDKAIASIEAAHMNYALGQLGIYENSKDMLKQMASQGMNLVGKFVEASIAATRREMGR